MHTLQYIAVEAEDKDEATRRVKDELESSLELGGTWFDWFVIGGGRWTTEAGEDTYVDTSSHTLSYTSDTARFHDVLKERKKVRKDSFIEDLNKVDKTILDKAIEGYLKKDELVFEYRMTAHRFKKLLETVLGYWSADSYYYDLQTFDHEFEGIEDRIKTNPTMQFLVPVDFHF